MAGETLAGETLVEKTLVKKTPAGQTLEEKTSAEEILAGESPVAIRTFILEALTISGASFREVGEDLVLAEVTVEIPPLFFDPPRLEKQTLSLVFDPEAAKRYPGAELVARNTPRLAWFVAGLKKRGRLTLQTIVYDPEAVAEEFRTRHPGLPAGGSRLEYREIFRPWLLVNYVIARYAEQLWEEPVSLGIDMSSGEIQEGFFALLQKAEMRPGVPAGQIARQAIPLEKAFALLREFLTRKIAAADRSWYENARRCYEEELFCLYRYYHEKTGVSSLHPEFTRKAKELYEQFRPRIEVRPVNFGLIYLPEFFYSTGNASFRFSPLFGRVEEIPGDAGEILSSEAAGGLPNGEFAKELPGETMGEKNPGAKSSGEAPGEESTKKNPRQRVYISP